MLQEKWRENPVSNLGKIYHFFQKMILDPKFFRMLKIAKLVKRFTALLEDVQQFFASQTHYHIYASSLLLVYDHCLFAEGDVAMRNQYWSNGELDKFVRLKIIDFAHVFPAHGQVDENFNFGLDNLCNLFKKFDCASWVFFLLYYEKSNDIFYQLKES